MRIQHNIAALNSYRQLNGNNNSLGKNLEKLSSGYRINRAGDDAAGLAISEKMRAQITGLETASKNANDGISLVQTAEGALTEVHSMLNRMVELADQSANGTYDDDTDRANLQKEVESLKAEINRISEGTNFNGINLLDGSLGGGGSAAIKNVKIENATTTESLATAGIYTTSNAVGNAAATASVMTSTAQDGAKVEFVINYKENSTGVQRSETISLTLNTHDDGKKVLVGSSGKEYELDGFATSGATAGEVQNAIMTEINKGKMGDKFKISLGADGKFTFEAREKGSDGGMITSFSEKVITAAGAVTDNKQTVSITQQSTDAYKELSSTGVAVFDGTNAEDAIFSVNGQKFVLAEIGANLSGLDKNVTVLEADATNAFTQANADAIAHKTGLTVDYDGTNKLTFKPSTGVAGKGGLTLQIGDTSADFNQLTVSVGDMSATALGVGSIDVSTQDGGKAAVDIIKAAINKVSSTRGDLGAAQNRLEHTINNLGVTTENMTAAESRIRDVDMANEMMLYTKNNILVQASTAMLAQANTMPQSVLQLLQ